MSLAWSNEETFKFIELYKAETVIWDPKNESRKDRNTVNNAWKRIAANLSIPVPELKKKKETLMTAFRMHYRKKKDSILSGSTDTDIYKPIWVYYDVLEDFLKDVYNYECKVVQSSEGTIGISHEEEIPVSAELGAQRTETLITAGSAPETDKDIRIPSKRRRSIAQPELENAEKEIAKAFKALNQALLLKEQKQLEDECDLYGRLVANKLRKYSEDERNEIMFEIDGLLLKRHISNGLGTPSFKSQNGLSSNQSGIGRSSGSEILDVDVSQEPTVKEEITDDYEDTNDGAESDFDYNTDGGQNDDTNSLPPPPLPKVFKQEKLDPDEVQDIIVKEEPMDDWSDTNASD